MGVEMLARCLENIETLVLIGGGSEGLDGKGLHAVLDIISCIGHKGYFRRFLEFR